MNATPRARWILALAATGIFAGLLQGLEPLALSGLILLCWLGLEGLNFWIRTSLSAEANLRVERLLGSHQRPSSILGVGQEVAVEVHIQWSSRLRGLHLRSEDILPSAIEVTEGSPVCRIQAWNEVGNEDGREGARDRSHRFEKDSVRCRYTIRAVATGRAKLPGVAMIVSDAHGLFQSQHFIRVPVELTILPFLVRPTSTVSVLKQQNVQMMTGTHRFRQPGFSTELLEIREYQPGDSPRSLAWKATARLDRLMTREYESEAPIRATIFADLSAPLFAGSTPSQAPAQRVIAATAGIARLLLADGDPISALISTGSQKMWIPHGCGERHLTRLLLRLVAIDPQPSLSDLYVHTLLSLAWHCAYRRFPSLFDATINRPPVPWYHWGRKRRRTWHRRQLAAVLAQIYHGSSPLSVQLESNNALFASYCRRLLQDHSGLVEMPSISFEPTEALSIQKESLRQICSGLLAAVARARDNELYILISSVPHSSADLDHLLNTIRVARGAHHRVVMVDVGPPAPQHLVDPVAQDAINESVKLLHQQRWNEFKEQLARLGGRIGRLDEETLLEKVAAEVEILRTGRARV